MMSEEIILADSPQAAEYRTNIKGWVSRNGRFYGENEDLARYDGSTHRVCQNEDCNNITTHKSWVTCDSCQEKKRKADYQALEYKEWDGGEVYSESYDQWFRDECEISDYIEETGIDPEDLDLVLARPQAWRKIDDCDFLGGAPEEVEEVPEKLQDAIDALNSVIDTLGPAWFTVSKFRTSVTLSN